MKRAGSARLKLALLVLSTLVALVAAELLCRVVLVRRWQRTATAWDEPLFRIDQDRTLAYRMHADTERELVVESGSGEPWHYTINAAGLRDDPPTARDGRRRVVVLGDSYTFGWAVDQGEEYPAQLERLLRDDGWPVDVINAGVPGYNTVQQARYLALDALALEPDLVVLGFVMNDGEPQNSVPVHPSLAYSNVRLWGFELAKGPLNRLLGASEEEPLFAPRLCAPGYPYYESFRPGASKGPVALAALARIAALCRANGVDFVCFVLPDFTDRFAPGYDAMAIHRLVRETCADADALCHDLLPAFLGRDHRALHVAGDGHPNARAHALFAATMAIAIRRDFPRLAQPR